MLSYPDYNQPNTIYLWDSNKNNWTLISNGLAEPLGTGKALLQQNDKRERVWWNAYSQNGSATSEIVYVNYGTSDDYKMLEKVFFN